MFFDLTREQVADAKTVAARLGVAYEIVIAYWMSERALPASFADLEEWAARPSPYRTRRDQGGPWTLVGGT